MTDDEIWLRDLNRQRLLALAITANQDGVGDLQRDHDLRDQARRAEFLRSMQTTTAAKEQHAATDREMHALEVAEAMRESQERTKRLRQEIAQREAAIEAKLRQRAWDNWTVGKGPMPAA